MRLELTRRGAYAIRAVLALSSVDGDEVVSSTRIADTMRIPARFLPQIMSDLVHARLVEARVGRAGGYRLAKPSAGISLLDVIEVVEGDTRRRTCVLTGVACGQNDAPCEVHEVFAAAQAGLIAELASTTFADIVGGRVAGASSWQAMVPAAQPANGG